LRLFIAVKHLHRDRDRDLHRDTNIRLRPVTDRSNESSTLSSADSSWLRCFSLYSRISPTRIRRALTWL